MRKDTGISPIRAIYHPVKTVAVIAMATTMYTTASVPALAFTPQLQDLFEEFVDCKILLLTDREARVRECLGDGTGPQPPFSSLSTLGPANTPPPPKEEDEEPDDGEPEEPTCPEGQVSDGEGGCEEEEEECDPYVGSCVEEPPCCYSPCYPSCFASCYPECPVY